MNQRKILKFSTTILFAIALAAAFFAKGLYFDQDYFIFAAVFSALFLLYLFTTKGEKTGINSLIDWFLMAAVVLYVVFAFFALSMRDTLLQATRYGIYLMAFLIGKNLLSNYKKPYLNIIYICGILLMLTGFSSAVGGPLVIANTYLAEKGLLLSPLQYHNVFASLSIILFLIGISLFSSTEKPVYRYLYQIGNFVLFLGILMSNSRGNWLIFPIVFIVYLIFGGKEQLKNTLTISVSSFVSAIAVLSLIAGTIQSSNALLGWVYLLAGCALSAALYFLFSKLSVKIQKKTAVVFIILLILLAVIVGIFYQSILPANMVSRIQELNLNARTLSERLTFYQDGFSIFKEYPLSGTGGNGWVYTYKQYQSYNYASNHPHSYFVLLMVELGVAGIALFLLLIVGFILLCVKGYKRCDNRILFTGMACGVLMFFLHVMFDFESSYSAYMVFIFSLLGIMASCLPPSKKVFHSKIALAILAIVILVWNCTLYTGYHYYMKASGFTDTNMERAIKLAQQSAAWDPLNAEYNSNVGLLLMRTATEDTITTKSKTAGKLLQKGYDLNSRNVTALTNYISYTMFAGNAELALKLVEQYIELQPLEPYAYFQKANLYTQIGITCQENNDVENLKSALQGVIATEAQFNANTEKSTQKVELNQETKQLIEQAKKVLVQVYEFEDQNSQDGTTEE